MKTNENVSVESAILTGVIPVFVEMVVFVALEKPAMELIENQHQTIFGLIKRFSEFQIKNIKFIYSILNYKFHFVSENMIFFGNEV